MRMCSSINTSKVELSVIIVNWNTTKYLLQCLDSIYSTLNDLKFEVIVIDNHSNDIDTEKIKKRFPAVKLYLNKKNKGFAEGNNQGIAKAQGDIILFLNPDIILLPETTKKMCSYLTNNESIGAISCKLLNPDKSLQRDFFRRFPTFSLVFFYYTELGRIIDSILLNKRFSGYYFYSDRTFKKTEQIDQPGASCLMMRTQTLKQIGHFDISFPVYLNDVDLCKRIHNAGYKIHMLADAEVIHYGGSAIRLLSETQRYVYFKKGIYKYFKKYHGQMQTFFLAALFHMDKISSKLRINLMLCYFFKYLVSLKEIGAGKTHAKVWQKLIKVKSSMEINTGAYVKMNILFLLRYNCSKASSRIRGFNIASKLRSDNVTCNIITGGERTNHLNFFLQYFSHNIIYFQKKYTQRDIALNKLAQTIRKITIFDLDDAPFGLTYSSLAAKQVITMMRNSSAVIVGGHKLLSFAKKHNNNSYLIPSSINLNHYKPAKPKNKHTHVKLGWIGDGVGYKNDLLMLIQPLEELAQKYPIELVIIGALKQKLIYQSFNKLKNMKVAIIDSLDWANPIAIPQAIANFDIGLYPLRDNEFNQFKCGFKALEYMAMEIPVVASPVGENTFIIEDNRDGFLVSNKQEWLERLALLITNGSERIRVGRNGREKVKKDYSLKSSVDKLHRIIKSFD